MKKFYKLDDIANFNNINNFFAASAAPTYKQNAANITLWSEAQFEDVFEQQSGKSFYAKETADPWGAFKNKYTQWLSRNGSFIANELGALLEKYNPIYNYDRHEAYSGSDTSLKTPDDWVTTKTETPDDWKETTTQTPTNWSKTDTQTPTQWTNTKTDSYTGYTETDTQTPTNWVKTTQTAGASGSNGESTQNQIIPFNGSDFANVSKATTQRSQNVTETQGGTYQDQKTISGTKALTETQSGTYQVTSEQTGTYETDRTKTGTETDTKVTSGTYQTETEQSGTFQNQSVQTGTYTTETATTGSRTETIEQTGTLEDKTTYGKKLDVEGNIGVTTTAEMITQIINLYDTDFIARWVTRFIDTYCAYV